MSISPRSSHRPPWLDAVIDSTAVETPPAQLPVVAPPAPVAAPPSLPAVADPPGPVVPGLRVDDDGGIRDHKAPDAGRYSQVTPEVFASDLRPSKVDAIRAALDAQRAAPGRAPGLAVTPDGEIVIGTEGHGLPLSNVTPEVFAAPGSLAAEQRVARQHLPAGSRHSSTVPGWPPGQPHGWLVTTTAETGDRFQYLLHWSPVHGQYRCLLVTPRLEHLVGPVVTAHDLHLYEDGTMCVTRDVGGPDIPTTYSRAAVWCEGVAWSIRNNKPFPFNPDQAPLR